MEDEIKYTIEGLTVNLNAVTSVKFGHDDCLPDAVQGDRQTLRLALVTLIEFGMKYWRMPALLKMNYQDCLFKLRRF